MAVIIVVVSQTSRAELLDVVFLWSNKKLFCCCCCCCCVPYEDNSPLEMYGRWWFIPRRLPQQMMDARKNLFFFPHPNDRQVHGWSTLNRCTKTKTFERKCHKKLFVQFHFFRHAPEEHDRNPFGLIPTTAQFIISFTARDVIQICCFYYWNKTGNRLWTFSHHGPFWSSLLRWWLFDRNSLRRKQDEAAH